jgi:hypothetical protein
MQNQNSPLAWAEAICFSEALYTIVNSTQDFMIELAFVLIAGMIFVNYKLLK